MPDQYDFQKLRQQQQYGPANPYFTPGPNAGYGPPNPFFSPTPDIGEYQDFSLGPPQKDYGHIDPFMIEDGGERQYGQQMPNPSVPGVSKYGPDEGDPRNPNRIWEMINKIYTPETQSRDRVNNLLDNVPERQDPSFARRLVAAGMGFGQKDPLPTMENVMYAPHNRAMADWTAKTKPFQEAYTTENAANVNERNLAGNAVAAQSAADRQASVERIADQKAKVLEIRNRAYAWKQMHPDWEWDTKGPTYVIMDPATHEIINTGIKTGQLGEEDEILLKNKGSLAAATAAGGAKQAIASMTGPVYQDPDTHKLYGIGPDGQLKEMPLPGGGAPSGTLTRPSTTTPKQPTQNQILAQEQQTYRDILKEYPQFEGQFKRGPNGVLTLQDRPKDNVIFPDSEGKKNSQKLWDQLDKLLHPNAKGIGPSGAASPAASSTSPAIGGSNKLPGAVVTPDDKAREELRAKVEIANAQNKANRPNQLRNIIANPQTPKAIREAAQRDLDRLLLEKVSQAPLPDLPQPPKSAAPEAPQEAAPAPPGIPAGVRPDANGFYYRRDKTTGQVSRSKDGMTWEPVVGM